MKCSSHILTLTRCSVKGKVYKKTTVSTYFLYVLEPTYRVYAGGAGYTYVGSETNLGKVLGTHRLNPGTSGSEHVR